MVLSPLEWCAPLLRHRARSQLLKPRVACAALFGRLQKVVVVPASLGLGLSLLLLLSGMLPPLPSSRCRRSWSPLVLLAWLLFSPQWHAAALAPPPVLNGVLPPLPSPRCRRWWSSLLPLVWVFFLPTGVLPPLPSSLPPPRRRRWWSIFFSYFSWPGSSLLLIDVPLLMPPPRCRRWWSCLLLLAWVFLPLNGMLCPPPAAGDGGGGAAGGGQAACCAGGHAGGAAGAADDDELSRCTWHAAPACSPLRVTWAIWATLQQGSTQQKRVVPQCWQARDLHGGGTARSMKRRQVNVHERC